MLKKDAESSLRTYDKAIRSLPLHTSTQRCDRCTCTHAHTHTHTNTAIQSLFFLAVSSHTYSAIQLLHEHTNLHSEKDNQKYTDSLHDFMCIYIYIHIPYIYIYIYQRCDRCHADCTCQRCDRCLQSMHEFHLHCFDSMFTHQTTHHSIVKHNFYHPTISAMLTCDPMMCHYDSSTH